jgi:GNAT superfamily N-acetyltransferase
LPIEIRELLLADIDGLVRCRALDAEASRADPRIRAYFEGQHHPRQARAPRVGYVALDSGEIAGYIAGHATERFGCDAEVQYLFVAPAWRRHGVASRLLATLADWFVSHAYRRVCVNVDRESPAALPFYESRGAHLISEHWCIWDDISVVPHARTA